MKTPTLLVITGPTAVGKTSLCVELAKHYKTEIISADSRQFYKELAIGTAKPDLEEMQGVAHHFIHSHSIYHEINVYDFEKEALQLAETLFSKHNIIILTGGSGLYIDAICQGFDENLPPPDAELRKELKHLLELYGPEILLEKLKQLDADFFDEIDQGNMNRVIRAIEVCVLSGEKYSKLRKGIERSRKFKTIKIALDRPREELFSRINLRVDKMVHDGLIEEVESLKEFKELNCLKTVGYTEIFEYLANTTTKDEAIEKIKVNSRRYAKRQIGWLKRSNDYTWFHPKQLKDIVHFIDEGLRK